MNRIIIHRPEIEKNRVWIGYDAYGPWSEVFTKKASFELEYSIDVERTPESIAVLPLLANILPIVWVYDAEIVMHSCDADFIENIDKIKQGYMNMYPMMKFGGKITVEQIEKNHQPSQQGVIAFFSGGVDAYNTLIQHIGEKPTLLTLWGSDIVLDDKKGWENVKRHLSSVCEEFGIESITVKTNFRRILIEYILDKKVELSGDGWWHGFQHGIGVIAHAAPVAYVMRKKTVYFASSFTAKEKGKVTCASDPSIDNNVHFCDVDVVHDGYEFNRQDKIHNIVKYSKDNTKCIELRVCWESKGGTNCCSCEKCWRTLLGLYAEGVDPADYGFNIDRKSLSKLSRKMRFAGDSIFSNFRYLQIQAAMRSNIKKEDLPFEIRWFFNAKLGKGKLRALSIIIRGFHLFKSLARKAKHLLLREKEKGKRLQKYFKESRGKSMVLLQTPTHGNVGDHAIALAEIEMLKLLGVSYVDFPWSKAIEKGMARITNRNKIILLHGGGFLGQLWPIEEERVRATLKAFRKNRVIILPQTVFFDMATEEGRKCFEASKSVYTSHPNLTVFLREKISYDFLHQTMPEIHAELVPDMAMTYRGYTEATERKGALICLRNDRERTLTDDIKKEIIKKIRSRFSDVKQTDTVVAGFVGRDQRACVVNDKLKEFASSELVVTDRLHGMVFAAITQTPCVVIESLSPKIRGCYSWIEDLGYIRFTKSIDELSTSIDMVMSGQPKYNWDKMEKKIEPLYDIIRNCAKDGDKGVLRRTKR